jgi:hypothetical protein
MQLRTAATTFRPHYPPLAVWTINARSHWFGIASSAVEGCCVVMPPPGASGQPVRLADSFDVPVIVRHSSPLRPKRRPWQSQIDHCALPWPTVRDVPPPGWYLVPTTWRDVIDAAMTAPFRLKRS